MTIKLIQFPSHFGMPCPSPFCMKAEILLKIAGQDYEVEIIADPGKSPKGKLPFISDDGTDIADSALIRLHLEQKYGVDFDAGLSDEQKAVAHAMTIMAEERLYWAIVYGRWADDHNWPTINKTFFGAMPPVIRSIIPIIARKQVIKAMHGHGIGRHSPQEIYAFGASDLAALATQLGEKQFMFGDQPTGLDAAAYPMIAAAMVDELPGPMLDAAKSHKSFVPYIARCQTLWFPDFKG